MRETTDDEAGRARFVTVMRGYDRIEVDEYVRDTRRTTQKLQAELAQLITTELAASRGTPAAGKDSAGQSGAAQNGAGQNGAGQNGAGRNGSQTGGASRDRK